MERLTFEGNFCDIAICQETPGGPFCEDGACSQRKVWERLKAYEDTGLDPLEILRLNEGREGNDIYQEFARAAVDILGENLGEAINAALHLYANSTEFHSYDKEQQDLIPILAALDSAGLNSVLPEYDILRGGSFANVRFEARDAEAALKGGAV